MLSQLELLGSLLSNSGAASIKRAGDKLSRVVQLHKAYLTTEQKIANLNRRFANNPGMAASATRAVNSGTLGRQARAYRIWAAQNARSARFLTFMQNPQQNIRNAATNVGNRAAARYASFQGTGERVRGRATNAVNMAANMIGGPLYYFAKGLNQATQNLGAWGAVLYTGVTAMKLLFSMAQSAARMLKEMIAAGDERVKQARSTQISSGSFGTAQADLKSFYSRRTAGEFLMTDDDYKDVKRRIFSIGADFENTVKLVQDAAYYTGTSVSAMSDNIYDAIMFGGTQLYYQLGMNEKQVQRWSTQYVEGTNQMRDAVIRLLKGQDGLIGSFDRAPKTIDEMLMRIRSFRKEMGFELIGDQNDPNSLYSVVRSVYTRIADFLSRNREGISQFFAGVGSAIKGVVRMVDLYIGRSMITLEKFINKYAVSAEELPKKLLGIEMYFQLMTMRVMNFWKGTESFRKGLIDGIWVYFKVLSLMAKLVRPIIDGLLDLISAAEQSNNAFVKFGSYLAGLLVSATLFGGVFKRIAMSILLVPKAFTKMVGMLLKPFKMMTGFYKSTLHMHTSFSKILSKTPLGKIFLTSMFGKVSSSFLKRLPVIGLLLGIGDAIKRFVGGDILGGIIALIGGVAAMFPGLGTAASIASAGALYGLDKAGVTGVNTKIEEDASSIGRITGGTYSALGNPANEEYINRPTVINSNPQVNIYPNSNESAMDIGRQVGQLQVQDVEKALMAAVRDNSYGSGAVYRDVQRGR